MKPYVITVGNGAPQVIGSSGRGLRLEPLVNVATGDPVEMAAAVRLDRDDSQVYVFEDDGARVFAAPFLVAELVGGVVGDMWRVTVLEAASEGFGAPSRVRRTSPLVMERMVWAPEERGGSYYLSGARGALSAYPGPAPVAFDVTRFQHLHLYAGLDAQDGQMGDMHVTVDVLGGPRERGLEPLRRVNALVRPGDQVGVLFGVGQGPVDGVGGSGEPSFITLPARPAWVRVVCNVPALGQGQAPGAETYVRLVGLE